MDTQKTELYSMRHSEGRSTAGDQHVTLVTETAGLVSGDPP